MTPEYCLFGVDWWATCMQKSEWASWAQAVFSVVAIVAAIAVAWWQRREERQHNRERLEAAAEVVADTVLLNATTLEGMLMAMVDSWKIQMMTGPLRYSAERAAALDKVPAATDEQLLHLANVWPMHARALAVARNDIAFLVTSLEHYIKSVELGSDGIAEALQIVEVADGAAKYLRQAAHGIRPTGRTEKILGGHAAKP